MRTRPRFVTLALVALAAAACTGDGRATPAPTSSGPEPVTRVKVAFIEDLSPQDAATRTAPAFQGARLAFDTATLAGELPIQVELVALDTEGGPDTAAAVARQVVGDPSFVGAIGAPFLTGQVTVGDVLDPAGVPMISLSTLGPDLSENGWTTWRRAVANVAGEGAALAAYVDSLPGARRGACLLGDGSSEAMGLLRAVAGALRTEVVLRTKVSEDQAGSPQVADTIGRTRCAAVVWGGLSTEGALVRRELVAAGLRKVPFVGGDGMKDATFPSVTAGAGWGTVASCPCVDLSTSTEFGAQRFIQDYQSEFGLPPGPYAVEAWDVARMFVRAFREGAVTRSDVLASLWAMNRFEGLANTYLFRPDGELAPGAARVHLFRDEGGRWIPFAGQ